MSQTTAINPRRTANLARATVVIGSGLALGVLSAHIQADTLAKAAGKGSASGVTAEAAKPKVVTIVRKKHVASDPIIVYRQVPSSGYSSGSSYSSGGSGGSSSYGSSGGGYVAPAPAPAPANNPAPAGGTSSAS